ncbi:MAG: hypothetical protein INR73_12990 [Williamsia sp.]|nr:hypothetical protein [Williamsia sp.]
MRRLNKLGHPVFLISVLTLILNDWWWKSRFHNNLTGKLSDFAGLFAFPFLLSALWPRKSKEVHLITSLLFLWWKTLFSQPFISLFNQWGVPIQRTVDLTDNLAQVSILLSFFIFNQQTAVKLKPVLQQVLVVVSCLAFMATTLPPRVNRKYVDVNKEYQFDFSKRELVSRLNMVQLKEIGSLNDQSGQIDFNSQTNTFHFHGETDTLAQLLDYERIKDQDTLIFHTSLSEILISGDNTHSTLKLLSVCRWVSPFRNKDYREKAIRVFEKRIIKRIKKPR